MKSVVLNTQGNNSLKDNIINTFGLNTFTCLEPLNLTMSEGITIEGFISKPRQGTGRNLGDRQFFYVNGRPVDLPKVVKLSNELYKSSNAKQYPIVIMNIIMATESYDVNVTPDKRKIFFSDECRLMTSLREAMEKIYSRGQCSYEVNGIESCKEADSFDVDITDAKSDKGKPEAASHELFLHDISFKIVEEIDEDVHVNPKIKSKVPAPEEKKIIKAKQLETLTSCQFIRSKSSDAAYAGRSVKCNVSENMNSSPGLKNVQPSLTKYLNVKKRKHENGLCSEVPLLRNTEEKNSKAKISLMDTISGHIQDDSSSVANQEILEHSGFSHVMKKFQRHSSDVCCAERNEVRQ